MTLSSPVSVLMCVYNPHPVFFPQAVQSVLEQTESSFELIVVEDPSPRSAADLLAQFNDPRIVHHCNDSRTSLVEQRNKSVELASGEFLAILDADDLAYPDRLEQQLQFFRDHPDIDVLGSQLAIIDHDGEHLGWREYPLDHHAIVRAMHRFDPLAQPSVMCRREAMHRVGGYNYQRGWAQDYQLWSRMAQAGVRFANHSEPLLKYRLHTGAVKQLHLKDTIRNTIDIKETYWYPTMTSRDWLRLQAERCLLWLPSSLILWLFSSIQYQRHPPRSSKKIW